MDDRYVRALVLANRLDYVDLDALLGRHWREVRRIPRPMEPPAVWNAQGMVKLIPSGKHTKSYGKWWFSSWIFPLKNGGSFHSYVSLPEGTAWLWIIPLILHRLNMGYLPKNRGLIWFFHMDDYHIFYIIYIWNYIYICVFRCWITFNLPSKCKPTILWDNGSIMEQYIANNDQQSTILYMLDKL